MIKPFLNALKAIMMYTRAVHGPGSPRPGLKFYFFKGRASTPAGWAGPYSVGPPTPVQSKMG